jgi:uncharacterized damage-inducible protein DinB
MKEQVMVPTNLLATDNVAILGQSIALLEQIDDELYTRVDAQIFRSCVGSHMRHLLDFYGAFLRGLPSGRIDYDSRQRDVLVEQHRLAALERLRDIVFQLEHLPISDGSVLLLARQDSSAPPEDPAAWGQSSLARELQTLVSHTIHHYALIAVLLRRHGFEPDSDFGVAPSTLLHWKRTI